MAPAAPGQVLRARSCHHRRHAPPPLQSRCELSASSVHPRGNVTNVRQPSIHVIHGRVCTPGPRIVCLLSIEPQCIACGVDMSSTSLPELLKLPQASAPDWR